MHCKIALRQCAGDHTGLAAVAEPARARVVDIETVGQMELRDLSCKQDAVTAHLVKGWQTFRPETRKVCPRPQILIIVPPVMLQGDRAHE